MQEQNAGTGTLSALLTPAWLNLTQISKQQDGRAVSNYVIGTAFSGTINGTQVISNLSQLTIPDPADISAKAKDKNQSNADSLSSMAELVGIVTSVGMLYCMAKGKVNSKQQKANEAKAKAATKEEADAIDAETEAEYQRTVVSEVKDAPQRLETLDVPMAERAQRNVDTAARLGDAEDMIGKQEDALNEVAQENPPTQATEDAADGLDMAQIILEGAADPTTHDANRDEPLAAVDAQLAVTGANLKNKLAHV
jgi:hypothetical protein